MSDKSDQTDSQPGPHERAMELRDGRCVRAASDTTFERTLERAEAERGQ